LKGERIERGARWEEKGERSGGFGKTALSFPFLGLEQGGRGIGRAAGALAGGPVHGDGREMGQHGEGAEGISAPCLPWAEVVCGGGSA
jgi:hypothetical protein